MKRKNMTRNALVTSILALLLCVSMLVGTTFAWFTDSVESLNNVITAGNLDVEVTTGNGEDIQDQAVLFDGILWEPGVVAYENLNIENVGTLALKYSMYINFDGQNFVIEADGTQTNYGLASVLKVAVVEGGVNAADRETLVNSVPASEWTLLENLSKAGKLYPDGSNEGDSAETLGIVIWWQPSDADNNWNVQNGKTTTDGQPLHINLGVNLMATQLTYEEDSFDNLYDENAKFDVLPNASVTEKVVEGVETIFFDIATGSINSQPVYLTLDTAYAFKGESPETAANNKYADWFVDFYVSLDAVPQEGLILSGQYDQFLSSWVAFYVPTGVDENGDPLIKANEFYPLLGSVTGGGVSNWEYTEICSGVGTFNCGALDESGKNIGTTMTVQLRLINPEDATDTIVAKEVKYTFGSEVSSADELNEALANGLSEIKLTKNLTLDKQVAIPKTAEVVLDLGGHTLSGAFDNQGGSALIKNTGSLTIKNGKVVSLAEYPDVDWGTEGFPTYATNTISNTGNLVIEGDAVIENQTAKGGASYAIDNYAGGTLTVNGGTILAKDVAIRMNTASATAANNVTINDGVISGVRAIWIHLAGSKAEVAPTVNLTINGGDFNSTSDYTIYSYSYGNSYANTNVPINGGDFEKNVAFGGGYKGDAETVTVTGGTFNGYLGRFLVGDVWEDIAKP